MNDAINQAWHKDTAKTSLARWSDLCKKEGWSMPDSSLQLMILVFGASWYFTRFIFYRGNHIIQYFEQEKQHEKFIRERLQQLKTSQIDQSLEDNLEHLRLVKNEIMLSILLLQLNHVTGLKNIESLLTELAEVVIYKMTEYVGIYKDDHFSCIICGMGRLSGNEMTFGSDLDLVFLSDGSYPDGVLTAIRKIMRHIAVVEPSGRLYAMDTRLRPHGSTGTLITPANMFVKFHQGERAIWERQMMTRFRILLSDAQVAIKIKNAVCSSIYKKYETKTLATEIINMRDMVKQQLGSDKNKINIKQGDGGLMDIDFITHYMQLNHGYRHPQLQTRSTRQALYQLGQLGLIDEDKVKQLLEYYNFFRTIESVIRVFDLDSTSSLSTDKKTILPIARAIEPQQTNDNQTVKDFLNRLQVTRDKVRQCFNQILTT